MPPPESPHSQPTGPAPLPASAPKSKSPFVAGTLLVAGVLVVAIAFSLLSRLHSEAALKRVTQEGAAVTFNVVHPSPVLTSGEISLPGSAQAFMDTAIYARTNGYLKSWKTDIGAR
ncbi:MAG: hypothetical protein WDN28_18105 [Chthoniobacter sp.]